MAWRWLRIKSKRMFPRGLFGRSLLMIVVPIVLLQAVVTYVFFERRFEGITQRLSDSVAGDISMLAQSFEEFPENSVELSQIARERGLHLIEDAAQAHGLSRIEGAAAPAASTAATYSFYPTKNLGCLGDGGAVVTDDPDLHRRPTALS